MVEIYFMVLHIFYTLTSVCTHMGKRMSLRIWATNCSCHTTRVPCFWRFHNNLAHLCVAIVLPPICRARGEQMFPRVLPPLALVMQCLCRVSHMQHTWFASASFKVFRSNWPMVSVTIPRQYAIVFQIKKVKRCSWDSLYPTRNIV